jgi:wyosine [tRNA(Phe)-imidazoG37] synthetase (radical SAM superfamily)
MDLVFGPVPSRRLGRSLGIDPVPLKTCSWNCVYCQLGRTSHATCERAHYVDEAEVVEAVRRVLHRVGERGIDWLTFVGSGEPTLHAELGWMLREVKRLTPLPVAVITNGSLLHREDVRGELLPADAVMPSLAAGNEELFRKIHRPLACAGYQRQLEGLRRFRECYPGPLWIEVMLLRGLNDSEDALKELAEVLDSIAPDEVHLVLPERPPSLEWVEPADEEGVMRATAILGRQLRVVHPQHGRFDPASYESTADAILAVVTRHPMRDAELIRILGGSRVEPEVRSTLERLHREGHVQPVERQGERFWGPAEGRY